MLQFCTSMSAKDYFEDITPSEADGAATSTSRQAASETGNSAIPIRVSSDAPQRGIRSISVSRPRARVGGDMRGGTSTSNFEQDAPSPVRRRSRWWLWGLAALCVVAIGSLGLFAFRTTTVTIVARSQPVMLDASSTFTAYPEATAAIGTLAYAVQTSEIEDSEVVPSSGTTHVETKASGSITVYNNYSASGVRLIKNTRFETPDGFIFRTPSEVVIPGKKGSVPGQVTITVVADAVGEVYNIGPIDKFSVPGLKSSPDMYAGVYAKSTAAFSGGFSGDQPAVAPGAMDTALAAVRGRLESKAKAAASALSSGTSVVFPDTIMITYQELPNTTEAGGGVRIHEKAVIRVPVFPADMLAKTVARSVSADAEDAAIKLVPGSGFTARLDSASSTIGVDPIVLIATGDATIVWIVDTNALKTALAGRDQDAFQGIVNQFPGVQEARARIEPFWKHTFPTDPSSIEITVDEGTAGTGR